MNALTSLKMDRTMVVRGKVGGKECEILLDSGASLSVVKSSIVPRNVKLRKAEFSFLRAANGTTMKILGKQFGRVVIGNSGRMLELYVVDVLNHDCIIGISGLKKLRVVLDFSDERISINEISPEIGKCSDEERRELKALLHDFRDLFEPVVPGSANSAVHKIHTIPHDPIVCKNHRIPLKDQEILENEIRSMIDRGVISHSNSPYRSPIVIVDKKDGTKRICVDYRKLNDKTIKNKYPLPNIEDMIEKTLGSNVFCVLDMSSAYWQIPLAKKDRYKTAFSTRSGHYEFNVMPFGLTNAPATQQEAMRNVLNGLQNVDVLLDDIIIYASSGKQLIKLLRMVFERFKENGLRLKMKKCKFMQKSIKYLGYILSGEGKEIDPEKVHVIRNFPIPKNIKQLRSFLGIASYCRKFLKNFAVIASPLYQLTCPRAKWIWSRDCDIAFQCIKDKLLSAPILAMPNPKLPYNLYTDACDIGMGGVLCQVQKGKERIIAFGSKREERLYAPIEKEAAAIVWALEHYRVYLKGTRFKVMSDHGPLKWLWSKVGMAGRIGRWQAKLLEYADGLLDVQFIPGKENQVADGLSRMPDILELSNDVFLKEQEEDEDFVKVKHLLLKEGNIWKYRNRCFVPKKFRKNVLETAHRGHFGIQRMMSFIVGNYYWPRYGEDVRSFIRNCRNCLKRDNPISLPESLPTSKYPFQRIVMDFAGPLPRTKLGNRYFLVIQDDYTRFLRILPTKDCSAKVVLDALNELVQEDGMMAEILTDNGSHFCSNIIKEWTTKRNVKHLKSPPGHQASNGMSERAVKTIKYHLRTMSGPMETTLKEIQYMYNRTIHPATGFDPFSLARGRSARISSEFLPMEAARIPVQMHVSWRRIAARSKAFKNKNNKKNGVNEKVDVGDEVMLWRPKMKTWIGPFSIEKKGVS